MRHGFREGEFAKKCSSQPWALEQIRNNIARWDVIYTCEFYFGLFTASRGLLDVRLQSKNRMIIGRMTKISWARSYLLFNPAIDHCDRHCAMIWSWLSGCCWRSGWSARVGTRRAGGQEGEGCIFLAVTIHIVTAYSASYLFGFIRFDMETAFQIRR